MIYELQARKLEVISEVKVPVRYKDLILEGFYRLDLLINDAVIVELKAVETVHPVHRAQVLSYLRLMDKRLGLLINFHVERLVVGVDRIVNKFGWPDSQACNRPSCRPIRTILRASAALRHVGTGHSVLQRYSSTFMSKDWSWRRSHREQVRMA